MPKPFALHDARATAEASTRPDRLAFKNADSDSAVGQMLAVDESEGVVTAIVSVTGIEDEVQDIIVPGAYKSTLTRRRPKVCWAHSWEKPVGRVLHIEELQPGDVRLPQQTKDGKPWPSDGGALVATMQFNMASEAGREAFQAVKFYSETGECEYSIGYQVPAGKSVRDKAGVRHIKALELYELSVVLFGAHTMTGTLSIKDAYQSVVEAKTKGRTATAVLAAMQTKDVGPNPQAVEPDHDDGVMVALYPDPEAADRLAEAIQGPDDVTERDDLHVTLAYLGNTYEVSMSQQEIVDAVTNAVAGENIIEGVIGGIGTFPADDDGNAPTWVPVDVPGLTMLRETIVSALNSVGADVKASGVAFTHVGSESLAREGKADVAQMQGVRPRRHATLPESHSFIPHITLGYNIGLIDPIPEIPVTFATVKVVYGQQVLDVDLGTVLPDEEDRGMGVKAYSPDLDSWDVLVAETTVLLDEEPEVKARTPGGREGDDSPVGTPGGRQNWVDKAGGLPRYIRMVAHALERRGFSKSRAIATAVNTIKRWAAGGKKVSPKVQAAAAAALAEWEKAKASKSAVYDPTLDGAAPTEVKVYPRLPGSVEARQDAIHAAVCEALKEETEGDPYDDSPKPAGGHVSIEATFEDRVIASRVHWDNDHDQRATFEIPYVEHDGMVMLGEPQPVELQVVAVSVDGEEDTDVPLGDIMPLREDVERITFALKHAYDASMESKAGRVLSAANEQQLRVAVGNLLAVLAAAGVRVEGTMDTPDDELPGRVVPNSRRRSRTGAGGVAGDRREEIDQRVDLTTTSPSATTKSAAPVVKAADLEATLAALLD